MDELVQRTQRRGPLIQGVALLSFEILIQADNTRVGNFQLSPLVGRVPGKGEPVSS